MDERCVRAAQAIKLGITIRCLVTGRDLATVELCASGGELIPSVMPAVTKRRASKEAPHLTTNGKAATIDSRRVHHLIEEWARYLTTQQAYSIVHVAKSKHAAAQWAAWASKHGWTPTAAMKWAQQEIEATSRKTAANKVSCAREWHRYLTLIAEMRDNPLASVKISKARRDRQAQWQPFEIAEVRRLIDVAEAREASSDRRRSRNGPLASTYYAMLALTGLRYSEARHQRWSDIDLARATIIVTADKAKRQDEIPLCTEAISVLRCWRKWSPGEQLFPTAPSAHTLRADMSAAGILGATAGGKSGEWHRFRKTAIAERAASGADVRNLHHFARHASLNTTLEIYDRVKVEQMREVANLMPRLNGFIRREQILGAHRENTIGEKNLRANLTSGVHAAEDMAVQEIPGVPPKHLHITTKPIDHCGTPGPEQSRIDREIGGPRPDVQVSLQNGAVGN